MQNKWFEFVLKNEVDCFFTLEVMGEDKSIIIEESLITTDKDIEDPCLDSWKDITITFNNDFLTNKRNVRLVEISGDKTGIIRMYDGNAKIVQFILFYQLLLTDLKVENSCVAKFKFKQVTLSSISLMLSSFSINMFRIVVSVGLVLR